MFTREVLQRLTTAEPSRPVVSIYARTDPRDPSNTSSTPGWQVALRNGLGAIAERLEAGDDRDERLAFRKLRERIDAELRDLGPAERGRSVAWFVDADGGDSERFTLQLRLRGDRVVWDAKPFVSPLVDIADRGAPTGIVLVSRDVVRLLGIEQAEPTEPENSTFELELGDWRPFGGTAAGSPGRRVQGTSHQESYEARVEAQRDQLFAGAAAETSKRLEQLGWERIVIVSETQVAARFRAALPPLVGERVIAESHLNLVSEDPHVIAEALEPLIEGAWLARAAQLADLARERAQAGGAAAVGALETLTALAEGRVQHLILDPDGDFSAVADMVPEGIGGPAELLGERAVEAAFATGAEVAALAAEDSKALAEAGGIAALLRY
jgi:Bacterial archaeo-eukaryotic release factor family 10